jgi:Na+-translocating ferredoxin:NAD+ oxidoreductase RnfD subunit
MAVEFPRLSATEPVSTGSSAEIEWRRRFPPVRLAWISLAVLGGYESYYLLGLGAESLVALPLVAAMVDLGFQSVRYRQMRIPDAALVTGLLLALLFPPSAPILLTGTATFAAISVRHILRSRGRPWLNPAASGVLIGTLLFALAPGWWVGIGPYGEVMMVALGALLVLRAPTGWRLPTMFLLTYGVLAAVQHLVVGATTDPRILLLEVVDPATLFFALFMMVEPRTAPGAGHQQVLYAGSVGVAAAFLPVFLPTIGILVSLLVGNLVAVGLRRWNRPAESAALASPPPKGSTRRARPTPARRVNPSLVRWPLRHRVVAGLVVLVVLVGVVSAAPPLSTSAPIVTVTPPGGGGGGGGTPTACRSDNPSIPATDLAALHKALGPSVIVSYSPSTGVVVFYDPVNHVTVTESDLYEDFGFAEFNGDDYAVSGCAP